MPIRLKFQSVATRTYIRGVRNGISARNSYTCAGEEITDEIIDYIQYSVRKAVQCRDGKDSTTDTECIKNVNVDLFNR